MFYRLLIIDEVKAVLQNNVLIAEAFLEIDGSARRLSAGSSEFYFLKKRNKTS